jgi:hypothetical protein
MATFLQVCKDTGARSGEVSKLSWIDVDNEKNTIAINNPEKGSNSRTLKVSAKTIAMIKALSKKYDPYIFNPQTATYKGTILTLRKRLADTLQNPRFKQIHLHSFRHWKSTMEFAKTKSLLHVMHILGHKNIKNTQIYMHLADFSSEEYFSAVANSIDEARKLIESGFSFVVDMEGVKLFSKRKYSLIVQKLYPVTKLDGYKTNKNISRYTVSAANCSISLNLMNMNSQ